MYKRGRWRLASAYKRSLISVCVAAAVWEVVSVSLLWLCVFECRVDFGTLTVVIAFHGLANVYTDCLHLVSKFPRFWQVAKRDRQIGRSLLSSLSFFVSPALSLLFCSISPLLLLLTSMEGRSRTERKLLHSVRADVEASVSGKETFHRWLALMPNDLSAFLFIAADFKGRCLTSIECVWSKSGRFCFMNFS